MYVRFSRGHFELEQFEEVRQMLQEGEQNLLPGIRQLPSVIHYYAGIDQALGAMVNVSVWDTLEHAEQMSTFQPMLDAGKRFRDHGIRFETIINYEVSWQL